MVRFLVALTPLLAMVNLTLPLGLTTRRGAFFLACLLVFALAARSHGLRAPRLGELVFLAYMTTASAIAVVFHGTGFYELRLSSLSLIFIASIALVLGGIPRGLALSRRDVQHAYIFAGLFLILFFCYWLFQTGDQMFSLRNAMIRSGISINTLMNEIVLFVGIGTLLSVSERQIGGTGRILLTEVVWVTLVMFVLLSLSRQNILAVLGLTLAYIFIMRPIWLVVGATLLSLVSAIYVSIYSLPGGLTQRIEKTALQLEQGTIRSDQYKFGLELFVQHPFFGVGFGRYPYLATNADFPLSATFPESIYVQLIAEGGIVGMCFLLGLVTSSIVATRKWPRRRERVFAICTVAMVFMLGLFNELHHSLGFYILLYLVPLIPSIAKEAKKVKEDVC